MHRRHLWMLLITLVSFLPAWAQPQEDRQHFEEAIDQFNFTTIRYVLLDDKNNSAAQQLALKLADLQRNSHVLFQELRSAYKGNSKTEQLSRRIDAQKQNFDPGKPLKSQLDAVISMIASDRQGKTYLAALQQQLQQIRDQYVPQEVARTPSAATENQIINDLSQRISALEQHHQEPDQPNYRLPMGVTISIVILSLLTLFNLAAVYTFYKKQQKRSSGSLPKENEELIRSYLDFELFPRIREDRKQLEKQIAALKEEISQLKSSKDTSSTSSERKQFEDTIKEKIKDIAPTEPVSSIGTTEERKSTVAAGKPKNRPNTIVPVKKYADYPREEGFTEQQLSDSSDRRSIYEIKIVPGNDIALFTIVDDPAIHEYAIQNRERLLKDACDFEITSSKHTRIEVQQPGKLQKKGNNTWQVLTKAKIKFV